MYVVTYLLLQDECDKMEAAIQNIDIQTIQKMIQQDSIDVNLYILPVCTYYNVI